MALTCDLQTNRQSCYYLLSRLHSAPLSPTADRHMVRPNDSVWMEPPPFLSSDSAASAETKKTARITFKRTFYSPKDEPEAKAVVIL